MIFVSSNPFESPQMPKKEPPVRGGSFFGADAAIDLILGEKPTLKQKIFSFFTKAAAYYSTDEELSKEARRHLLYKKKADNVGGRTSEKTRSGGSTNDTSASYSISDLHEFVKAYDKDFVAAPTVNEVLLNYDGTPRENPQLV